MSSKTDKALKLTLAKHSTQAIIVDGCTTKKIYNSCTTFEDENKKL